MNRLLIKSIMITVFLLSANFAMASVNVYMYSKVDVFGNEVSIDDIASVEDDNPNVVKKIEKTVIPKSLIKDGYLDAQNLVDYLKQIGYNNVKVYGNAVKINMLSPKTDTDIVDVVDEILVKTDMPVRVVLNKNKIQIGITGKALKNGRSGDDIPVKVRDKIIYCKIIGNNLVEKE